MSKPELYGVLFEKLSEPTDQVSIDVLEHVFGLSADEATDLVVLAVPGDKIFLFELTADVAEMKLAAAQNALSRGLEGCSHPASIGFEAHPMSQLALK